MKKLIYEGEVKFYAYVDEKISSKQTVFYNPEMELARAVAVDIVKRLRPDRVCCLMDASGVRSLRLHKEAGAANIVANDRSSEACKLMKKNFSMNKADIEVVESDANAFLQAADGFDYIDVDPFGSPVKFLD